MHFFPNTSWMTHIHFLFCSNVLRGIPEAARKSEQRKHFDNNLDLIILNTKAWQITFEMPQITLYWNKWIEMDDLVEVEYCL